MQDLPALSAVIRELDPKRERIFLHTDAVQAPGHVTNLDVDRLGVDFLTLGAHKFHGPPGVGILYCRQPAQLRPLFFGGQQQGGVRPGTESVSLACALADALVDAHKFSERRIQELNVLTGMLWNALAPYIVSGLVLPTGPPPGEDNRAANHVSFCVRDIDRTEMLRTLESDGVVASGGSACGTDSILPSPVLVALGIPPRFIHGSVRFSVSHTNTRHEIASVVVPALHRMLQSLADKRGENRA